MESTQFCRAAWGGKAAELCALREAGFNVPAFEVSPLDLAAAVDRLGFPLVVRSSASLEDGTHASFAGLFRSFLRLRSLAEVQQAVAACQSAVDAPEVREYCLRLGIDAKRLRMHFVLQRMIEPELAGVVFTVDPVGGTDRLVINACEGLGEDLLAGRVTPVFDDHPRLTRYRPQITQIARKIEAHFGAPQDIEFAIADGHVHILQSRPITRIGFAEIDGEWTTANFRDGGVSSDVCSTLMASLYALIWNASIKQTLRETHLWTGDFEGSRLFFGRPYWNLAAVKQSVALLPGYVEREFDDDLGVDVAYDGPGQVTPFRLRTLWRALRVVTGVRRFLRRQEHDTRRLLSQGLQLLQAASATRVSDTHWRTLIERDYFEIETNYFRSVFAVSLVKQDFKRSFPDCEYSALVAALPPLRHRAPVERMREMLAAGQVDVEALIAEFPHPSRWGLDVRHPRWDEEPEFVRQLAHSLPPQPARAPHQVFQQAHDEYLRSLPWRRRSSFQSKLRRLRELVWLREELRDVSSRMYHLIRRQALRLADEHGWGDDVFHMTHEQIARGDRSAVSNNRATFQRFRNFRAPGEVGRRYRRSDPDRGPQWRGIAASAGVAHGVARIAHTVAEAAQLPVGCVLVCPFTEPSWTTILDRFTAVVAETGGQLSHAAVLCREFGIPAVLSVAHATQLIADGTPVTVHGGEGWVVRCAHGTACANSVASADSADAAASTDSASPVADVSDLNSRLRGPTETRVDRS